MSCSLMTVSDSVSSTQASVFLIWEDWEALDQGLVEMKGRETSRAEKLFRELLILLTGLGTVEMRTSAPRWCSIYSTDTKRRLSKQREVEGFDSL